MRKDKPCSKCAAPIYRDSKTGMCLACYQATLTVKIDKRTPEQRLAYDREKQRLTTELAGVKYRYQEALKVIEQQEQLLGALDVLRQGDAPYQIEPQKSARTSESTVVLVASDWHVEENVGAEIGGLNTYNLDIAKTRATKFFQAGACLTRLLQQDTTINTIVLALLGDFITNDIHDELSDVAELQPIHALVEAQNMLISGIEFLLKEFPAMSFVLPCHSGNHARTTKTTRFTSEAGHSLEYLLYLHLASYFRSEKRVQFIIPPGIHSYVSVYDTTIRFHHGHALKYQGGVGGIYIPVNKALAQWNKAKHADLDVFGHFHQLRDGGNFLCNGSLIGYNAFALSIKADYEPPRQLLFLINKKRGRTCTWPVLVS